MKMTQAQVKKLRDAYANIEKIDVSGQAYKQLVAFLDKQNLDTLKMLAGAKIKFISPLAQNRVVRKMNESIGSTVGGALGQYAGAKIGMEGPGRASGEVLGRQLEMFARALLKKLTKEEIELEEAKEVMVCKDCGDEFDKPTTDCPHDSHDPNGKNWIKKEMNEASSPAQQAAIAISMKKMGKKPMKEEEDGSTKDYMVKFEKQGKVSLKNYTGKSELDVRSKAKVDAKRMGMTVASVRLKEEVEQIDEISADVAKRVAQARDRSAVANKVTPTQSRRGIDPDMNAAKALKSAMKRGAKNVYGEEVEEAVDPQKSMKRASLSVQRAKEVMRHRKEIGTIRKKREALRNSFDPVDTVLEAYKKSKMKKEATAKDKNKSVQPGDKLSGKAEPIEIDPELKEQKT